MKANPGLGTIKNAKTLKDKVEKAKKNPIMVKNLLCKEFNIRETSSEAWLTFEQANKANFGYDENTERFQTAFEKLRDSMALSGDYAKEKKNGNGGTDLGENL